MREQKTERRRKSREERRGRSEEKSREEGKRGGEKRREIGKKEKIVIVESDGTYQKQKKQLMTVEESQKVNMKMNIGSGEESRR